MFELIGRAQAYEFPKLTLIDKGLSLSDIATRLVTYILILAGIIAVIYLIYGGILYITAGGDAEKATKGRTAVVNAVIGVVIIMLALVIVQWVVNIIQGKTA